MKEAKPGPFEVGQIAVYKFTQFVPSSRYTLMPVVIVSANPELDTNAYHVKSLVSGEHFSFDANRTEYKTETKPSLISLVDAKEDPAWTSTIDTVIERFKNNESLVGYDKLLGL